MEKRAFKANTKMFIVIYHFMSFSGNERFLEVVRFEGLTSVIE